MKTNLLKIIVMVAVVAIATTGCKSSKQTTGYNPEQKAPTTTAQQQSANRGVKLQKEECEEMALEESKNLRESGNAIGDKEAFTTNLALLDARAKLAQQLEAMVNGLIRRFDQQHEAGKDLSSSGKGTQIQQSYFEQFLTNTRPICKNTYVKEDGKYNVYVCIEMNEQTQRAMYKKLSEDQKVAVDFEESQFLKELQKAKDDFREQQAK